MIDPTRPDPTYPGPTPPPPARQAAGAFAADDPRSWPSPILRWFEYDHLPEHLQGVSRAFSELAHEVEERLPAGPEKSTALRKLLEAKDAAVRAAIDGRSR